ncbi:peptidylprolyl isomerase [Catenulispora sp. NF23]|uniref:Peptidyl-prolyl cis-trans isomerase n=1 Tax=Catenulispora pinistramenti TaxID=2705254 RepID=A0ABS5KMK8_9ACTN|nr:peptidylprolyl isomerase [Catenulispora pinistramenti]MBS2537500.1 peptidylprolyl isomerase [Catenulispora pinistramenti]MBS2547251.1 peptidylprolyl isomerase [Catenulispora pinistramenti]
MTSKDRQRELERARYERVQARLAQQQAAAKKRNKITAAVAAVAVIGIGVGVAFATSGGNKTDKTASSSPTSSPSDTSSAPTTPAPTSSSPEQIGYQKTGSASKDVGVPTYNAADAAKPYTATIHFNSGDLTFDALTTKAPYTTYSFKYLSGKGYFDNTPCHRLVTQSIYVLQCGDPTGKGDGGPGYQFQDENLTGATYPAGTIAMANGGPGTNGSQFFIVYKDSPLPPSYTPWGKVTSGMDVVTAIAAKGEDDSNGQGDGKPKQPVTIKSVTVK